jgi:hypothetical protein
MSEMRAETPVDPNSQLFQAWERYKQSERFVNSRKWALHPDAEARAYVDGSMWAAFEEGFNAALSSTPGERTEPTTADFDALLKAVWQAAGNFREKECNVIRDLIHYFNVKRQAAPGERNPMCECGHRWDAHVGGCAHSLPSKVEEYTGRAIYQMCPCKQFQRASAPGEREGR